MTTSAAATTTEPTEAICHLFWFVIGLVIRGRLLPFSDLMIDAALLKVAGDAKKVGSILSSGRSPSFFQDYLFDWSCRLSVAPSERGSP